MRRELLRPPDHRRPGLHAQPRQPAARRRAGPAVAVAAALLRPRRGLRPRARGEPLAGGARCFVELVPRLPDTQELLSSSRPRGRPDAVRGAAARRLRDLAPAPARGGGGQWAARAAELVLPGRRDGRAGTAADLHGLPGEQHDELQQGGRHLPPLRQLVPEYHHAVARLPTNPWSSDTSDSILSMTQ